MGAEIILTDRERGYLNAASVLRSAGFKEVADYLTKLAFPRSQEDAKWDQDSADLIDGIKDKEAALRFWQNHKKARTL